MPLPVPDPAVARRVEGAARRVRRARHRLAPETLVRALDPDRKVALLGDGGEMPYDLFLGVPVHRAPEVVARVGHDRRRLDPGRPAHARDAVPRRLRGRRRHQRRHAEGRRVRRGPGRGRRRRASSRVIRGAATPAHYDGRGICYLEFGHDQVAKVDVTFAERPGAPRCPRRPVARLAATRPSSAPAASGAGSGAPGPERQRAIRPSRTR